jgi:hypothetical protein
MPNVMKRKNLVNELVKAIEAMCVLVDKFAKIDVTPNTPLHNFQQSMIENVKRYREKKLKGKDNDSAE